MAPSPTAGSWQYVKLNAAISNKGLSNTFICVHCDLFIIIPLSFFYTLFPSLFLPFICMKN